MIVRRFINCQYFYQMTHDLMHNRSLSHGANDPHVPIGEAEPIVAALRSRNVSVV
jgi:predicted esterase